MLRLLLEQQANSALFLRFSDWQLCHCSPGLQTYKPTSQRNMKPGVPSLAKDLTHGMRANQGVRGKISSKEIEEMV